MSFLTLPAKFEIIIQNENSIKSQVHAALSNAERIYKANRVEFFPEYTDHGIEHVQKVLDTSVNIIDNVALNLLTPNDVLMLVCSVLLHDIGLHLTQHGLFSLLNGDNDDFRNEFFDNKTWKEEWNHFYDEYLKFNERQIDAIFGEQMQIDQPNLASNNLNYYQRLYCGEFIRRHHGRLAHEIALKGICNIDKSYTNVLEIDKRDVNEIVGLIARSHTMNLRDLLEYLRKNYGSAWRVIYDSHVVFLMVVLRISDYIQISNDRADEIIIRTKIFSSPVSKKEFELNQSVNYVTDKTDDPELLYVNAKPPDSRVFLKLEKLLTNIQLELDMSWAVLGEVYGSVKGLDKLRIRFRRIKSNIQDKDNFANKVNYIPNSFSFTAEPALLKFLISPL